jgi:hypothetical protein
VLSTKIGRRKSVCVFARETDRRKEWIQEKAECLILVMGAWYFRSCNINIFNSINNFYWVTKLDFFPFSFCGRRPLMFYYYLKNVVPLALCVPWMNAFLALGPGYLQLSFSGLHLEAWYEPKWWTINNRAEIILQLSNREGSVNSLIRIWSFTFWVQWKD